MKHSLLSRRSRPLLCTLALAGLASVPAGQAALNDPARTIVRMADANGDGTITGEEWVAFLNTLQLAADGELDGYAFKARMLGLDADGDGELLRADVVLVLNEPEGGQRGFLVSLANLLADTDADGLVSEEEREAFLAPLAEGSIGPEVVADWMRRAEAIPPEDVNAMTPGVVLLSLGAAYDTDGSGTVTLVDLNAMHRGLDANGDGVIDPAELRAGRQGGSFGDWSISREQRERGPVMPWQRNLEDALLLSKRTGKPLLLCVNVDGENASENLAWGRYRDSAFGELADGFICLLASPDRHSVFDRDDHGRRIEDPRFGRLIDPEHVDIEPTLYERWFNGRRVAPRHVGVSSEGELLFDLFLLQDLTIVDAALREHGRPVVSAGASPGGVDDQALLDSPDAGDRMELERRFALGTEELRVRLAGLALSAAREVQHPELIRLALRDSSPAVRRAAILPLVQAPAGMPLDQVPAAFALVAGDAKLTDALLVATWRAAEIAAGTSRGDLAAFHARAREGLLGRSSALDPERWSLALGAAPAFVPDTVTAADEQDVIALLPRLEAAVGAAETAGVEDAELWLWLAAARMRAGEVQIAVGGNPSFFFEDAAVAARRALDLRPGDGRALALAARSAWMRSKPEEAGELAASALPGLLRDASTPLALAVLKVFANTRVRVLYAAMQAGEAWDPVLLTDAVAAYEVLVEHPGGTEGEWKAYLDLLGSVSAFGEQADVVHRAVNAHPASPDMHNYLRFQVLRDGGSRALEAAYDAGDFALARGGTWEWFHGLATLVAAEHDVQLDQRADARGAYARCVERFDLAVGLEPAFAGSAGHYQALALAGLARIDARAGRYGDAHAALLRAFELAPGSAESADGLGVTPLESAREVARILRRSECPELADDLTAHLAELGLEL